MISEVFLWRQLRPLKYLLSITTIIFSKIDWDTSIFSPKFCITQIFPGTKMHVTHGIGVHLRSFWIKIFQRVRWIGYIEQLKIEIFIQNIILTHCAINVYAKNLADSWHLEKPMLQYAKAKKVSQRACLLFWNCFWRIPEHSAVQKKLEMFLIFLRVLIFVEAKQSSMIIPGIKRRGVR